MRYLDGGGLTSEGRSRRERMRLQAAQMHDQGMGARQVIEDQHIDATVNCLIALPSMPSVLVIGIDPLAVPGMDGAAVRAALDQELARFGDHAIDASMLLIALDESAESAVASALSGREWDVVVIGGGIRKPDPFCRSSSRR